MSEELLLKYVGLFVISLIRISGFFINLPGFGERTVPNRTKAGLSVFMVIIILPHLVMTQSLPEMPIIGYGFMAMKELTVGLIMGFVVIVSIEALKFAGALAGMQIGLSFVQVANPESSASQAVLAELLQLFSILMFLMLEGHTILTKVLMESFDVIPINQMVFRGTMVEHIVKLTSGIFWLGLQVAMPMICAVILTDLALGIIARTVPRMSVFEIGFAVKIAMGYFMMIVLFPYVSDLVKVLIQKVFGDVSTLMSLMAPVK
ncbi:MAG: flagellar biosynthetic protein FliR [Candidatus Riflebacteria bacterium]|nr:flagellar biosynthetic protein FliR [Candidatus Riflebacteria bacterium]